LTAARGNQRAEFSELEGAEKRVKRAADPYRKEEPSVGENRGDAAGRANDADRDGVANRDGYSETDAEDLEKFAFVWPMGNAGRRRLDGALS
jgi:hypothetical protein